MEETNFNKDCMGSDLASSTESTHISGQEKTSKIFGKLSLNKFDLDNNLTNPKRTNYLIIGARTTGKTTLIKDITRKLNSKLNLSKIYLFANSYYNNYSDIFERVDLVQDQIDPLKYIIQERKTNLSNNKPILIIFDDMYSFFNKNNNSLKELIVNGRHLNIYVIMSIQYPVKFSPEINVNFDWIFIHSLHNYSDIKKLYELYLSIFPTFENLNDVMKHLEEYEFLVKNNSNSNTNKILDLIGWYKAEIESSSELLSLSEIKKSESVPLTDKNTDKILEKINKNNLLISKLSEENKKLLETILAK